MPGGIVYERILQGVEKLAKSNESLGLLCVPIPGKVFGFD